jgi:multidrug efflux system membrane fusion protein
MDLTRYQTLAQQNSIAKQQADDQVFIVQQYAGSVKQDQGLVDAQNLNIAYCHIVSPVTGRVGLRLVDPGNYVQTTATSGIAVITQLQPITTIFSVPEDELPGIMPQLNAGGTPPVTVYDRANLHELAVGQVSAVDNQIDTTTGTVKVRAQFDNTDNKLFPNQFVNARLLITTLKNVVTVPTSAIQRGSPGAYVYVINADNTVSVRQIVTSVVDGDLTAVNSGLSAGERVVIDGTDRLRDGLHVIVAAENGQPAGPPGARGGGQGKGQGNQGQRSAQPQNGSPPSGP